MQCYADFEADLLRWKIIRRNVCTAVAYRDLWGKGKFPLDCSHPTKCQMSDKSNPQHISRISSRPHTSPLSSAVSWCWRSHVYHWSKW